MSKTLYLAGTEFNKLESTATTITVSDEDSLFLKENLYDKRPSRPFKFNTTSTGQEIEINLGSTGIEIDICAIHGHNCGTGITVQLRNSTSTSTSALVATMTKRDPAFFEYLVTGVKRKVWILRFNGSTSSPLQFGEVVLGNTASLTKDPRHDMTIDERRQQIKNETRSGEVSVYNVTDFAQRTVTSQMRGTFTDLEDIRTNLWHASNDGQDPVVIVPYSDRPDVIYGRLREDLSIQRTYANPTAGNELYEYEVSVTESGWGTSIST